MTAPADFQLSLQPTDLEVPSIQNPNIFWQELGAELVFTQNAAGKYLSFYWQAAETLGLQPEQVVGYHLSNTWGPVDSEAYLTQIQRILACLIPERGSYLFAYGEQSFLIDLTISPILKADGTATNVLVMGHIQSQTLAGGNSNSAISINPEYYQQQRAKIARNIRRTLDLDTIWQKTVQGLGKALGVSRCIICSYKPSSSRVRVVAEYCQEPFRSLLGQKVQLADEPELSKALTTGQPIVVEGALAEVFDAHSMLIVATCYQDQPNGLISLQQCDRSRHWNDAEIEMVRDLADQVGTAIAHAILYNELEEARAAAEESSRLKSEFLASTSHELRTPLNGMICSLKLILDGTVDEPEEQLEFIQDAYRSALHLLNIINDILDIAKIEAGKMELELAPLKLNQLFQDVENFTQTQAEQKQLSFRIELPPTHDEVILYGNYQRLLQVMLNLVGNAIKFTHEGGVTLSAEVIKKKLAFNNQELPGMVRVRVEDTGIGVSLEKQDRLFQSFSQVHGGHNRPYGGTGLGLAISQKLIETMGGKVNFFSMGEGLGSTVTFTVPLYQEPVISYTQPNDAIDLLL
jgi:signal transduction histidine kinase